MPPRGGGREDRAMRIAAVGSALPEHYYDQETLLDAFREQWAERYHNVGRIERLHRNVLVGGRHQRGEGDLEGHILGRAGQRIDARESRWIVDSVHLHRHHHGCAGEPAIPVWETSP